MLKVNDTVRTRLGRLARVVSTPRDQFNTGETSCVVEFQGGTSTRMLVRYLTKVEPTIRKPVMIHEVAGVECLGCHGVTVDRDDAHVMWPNSEHAREYARGGQGVFGIWRVKHRHMPRRAED